MPGPLAFIEEMLQESTVRLATEAGLSVAAYAEKSRREEAVRARAASARQAAERAEKLAAETAYRTKFGAGLGLAVPAHIGHIIRLAGLSERSSGNGTVRNTVYHLVLGGDVQIGKLSRKSGDLLCRPAATVGRRRSLDISGTGAWNRDDVLDNWWHGLEVNCAACRKVLDRLRGGDCPPHKAPRI